MSVIIITPPPTKPTAVEDDVDGMSQNQAFIPYREARELIDQAEAAGALVRIIEH
jgi:hypothetical protein